jgi:hypothetical protein
MNRKEVKEFVETLHFHGYIDHDITKLDNLIDDYYPKQCDKANVSGSFTLDDVRKAFEGGRDSVEADIGYEHFGDMEAYPKKKIVKSFKQWMHENYR